MSRKFSLIFLFTYTTEKLGWFLVSSGSRSALLSSVCHSNDAASSGVGHDNILLSSSSSRSSSLVLSQLRGGDNGGEAAVELLDEGAGVV